MSCEDFHNGVASVLAAEGRAAQRPLTFLLAEDEPATRERVSDFLQEAGYRVIAVQDGAAAVQAFVERNDEVDFLLFDLVMPRMNGWEAYRRIAQVRPGIPHLFMSGHMWDIIPHEELERGFEETLIRKPFTPHTLRRRLENLSAHQVAVRV